MAPSTILLATATRGLCCREAAMLPHSSLNGTARSVPPAPVTGKRIAVGASSQQLAVNPTMPVRPTPAGRHALRPPERADAVRLYVRSTYCANCAKNSVGFSPGGMKRKPPGGGDDVPLRFTRERIEVCSDTTGIALAPYGLWAAAASRQGHGW